MSRNENLLRRKFRNLMMWNVHIESRLQLMVYTHNIIDSMCNMYTAFGNEAFQEKYIKHERRATVLKRYQLRRCGWNKCIAHWRCYVYMQWHWFIDFCMNDLCRLTIYIDTFENELNIICLIFLILYYRK